LKGAQLAASAKVMIAALIGFTQISTNQASMFGYLLKVGSIKRTERARLLVRLDHVASFIANENHSAL
jgi:hypothetical protein